MSNKRLLSRHPEPEVSENLPNPTFFDVFADVHTPPECLPATRIGRIATPYELSEYYMREAFRRAVRALGLKEPVHSDTNHD